jgi:hypothetical protein
MKILFMKTSNVEVIHEVATEGNRLPSPQDGRLPDAFRVLGPDYVDGEEEVTVISSPSVNSPSSTSAANVTVLAHLVDNDVENRILNQRIQEALQEEWERAAVAEVVPQPAASSGMVQQETQVVRSDSIPDDRYRHHRCFSCFHARTTVANVGSTASLSHLVNTDTTSHRACGAIARGRNSNGVGRHGAFRLKSKTIRLGR